MLDYILIACIVFPKNLVKNWNKELIAVVHQGSERVVIRCRNIFHGFNYTRNSIPDTYVVISLHKDERYSKFNRSFDGTLKDKEVIAVINSGEIHVSPNTYYKHKRAMR